MNNPCFSRATYLLSVSINITLTEPIQSLRSTTDTNGITTPLCYSGQFLSALSPQVTYIAGPRHFLDQLLFRNIFCGMNTIVASPIFLGLNTHILQMLNLWTTLFSPEIRVILVLHFVAFSQRSLRTCQCAAVLYGLQVCLRFARLISGLRIRPDLIR